MSFPWPVIEADQILNDALDIAMRISTCRRARRSALTWNPSPGRPSSTRLAARGEEQERSINKAIGERGAPPAQEAAQGVVTPASAPVSTLAIPLPSVRLKHFAAGAAELGAVLFQTLLDSIVAGIQIFSAKPRRIARAGITLFRRAALRQSIGTSEKQHRKRQQSSSAHRLLP